MIEHLLSLLVAVAVVIAGLVSMAETHFGSGVCLLYVGAMLAVWVWADVRSAKREP